MSRVVVLAVAALVGLTACGASDGPPEVRFTAASASVVARPTQYCDLQLKDCQSDPKAFVRLRVPAGTALTVAVAEAVSAAPWQVAFTYRSADGTTTDGRSPVQTAAQHTDYTLQLPAPTDVLVTAQVQQYGPAPQANAQGEIEFPIRASWVLNAN